MFRVSSHIFFYILVTLLSGLPLYTQADPLLSQAIDEALTKNCLNDSETAVSVVALPEGTVVYSRNAEMSLLPASVMKLVTTAAALYYLGPEYRFSTDFMYTGQKIGEEIQGDLVIHGGGDPKLTTEELWYTAKQVKGQGISKVKGNLLVDTFFFDSQERAPTWRIQSTQRAYDANLCALSINFNTISVHALPGEQVGSRATVWVEPELPYIEIINNTSTVQRGRNAINAQRVESATGMKITVNGRLSLNGPGKVIYLNVQEPSHYAAETFRTFLKQVGVTIEGNTIFGLTPPDAIVLYRHQSPHLSSILKELNLYSNNFVAEQIVKTIAADVTGKPGSHEAAGDLVMRFLQNLEIDTSGMVWADGSGLSRDNRMSASTVTDLLKKMYNRFDIGPEFISSLRIMGTRGAVSKRLADSPGQSQIRGKTGTLNGLSNLAGYVATANKLFAYAIFLNNNRCGGQGADAVEDRIVNAIYNLGIAQ